MEKGKKTKVAVALLCCAAMVGSSLVACGKKATDDNYFKESNVEAVTGTTTNFSSKNYSDFGTAEECFKNGRDLSIQIASEGDVLLKNANNALPLKNNERKVSLFGIHSVNLYHSTQGSGAGRAGQNGIPESTLFGSLKENGFSVNPTLVSYYKKQLDVVGTKSNEIPVSGFSNTMMGTYNGYNGAAIVTFSRLGSESKDLPTLNCPGYADGNSHSLKLEDNERDLIKHVKKYFNKVIVLINSSNIMEVPELAEDKTSDNLGVDAILWVGNTGNNGIEAVPKILTGEVNPSGKTVDLWASDFTKAPTFSNFSSQRQMKDEDGNSLDAFLYYNDEDTGYRAVEYREDIYMGYRYYETKAKDMGGEGDKWYSDNVVYPFGYGLSYTSFKWELASDIAPSASISAANQTVTLKVNVTNTGTVSGKDVVQVYYSAPYTKGGIEKASTNLVTYGKTNLLAPGESQELTLKFVAQDMASFDYDDKNKNDFKGYELEKGNYTISLNKDSHTPVLSVTRSVADTIKCATDYTTGAEVKPIFTDTEDGKYDSMNDTLKANILSRANGLEQPKPASKADRTLTQAQKELLDGQESYRSYQDQETDPWYVSELPSGWDQGVAGSLKIQDLTGVDYAAHEITDGKVSVGSDEGSQKWETLMNELSWTDLTTIIQSNGAIKENDTIGLSPTGYSDGPVQFSGGTLWASAPITAATYNTELAEAMGRQVGNEAFYKDTYYWAGPGMNIHRSPFSGRNQEYYSEDGVQGGIIAAAVINGATSKGLNTYVKHMFLNDQEAYRDINGGVATYASEQAIREIYAKGFEYALKHGGSTAIMSSFNRVGNVNSAQNAPMHKDLVAKEWGSKAIWVTDAWMGHYCPVDYMVRVGDPEILGDPTKAPAYALETGAWSAADKCVKVNGDADGLTKVLSPTHYANVRIAAQRILYTAANSAAVRNGLPILSNLQTTMKFDIGYDTVQSLDNVEGLTGHDFSNVQLKSGSTLPNGFTMNDGKITGKGTDSLNEQVVLTADIDGFKSAEITVNLVGTSVIHDSGTAVNGYKVGQAADTLFDSVYYTYGKDIPNPNPYLSFAVVQILNLYEFDELKSEDRYKNYNGWCLADELESRGNDCRIQPLEKCMALPASKKHEFTYTITNADGSALNIPGLSVELVTTKYFGAMLQYYDVVSGIRLKGTPTTAGTYNIKITLNVPTTCNLGGFANCFGDGFIPGMKMPPSEQKITRDVTITVAA